MDGLTFGFAGFSKDITPRVHVFTGHTDFYTVFRDQKKASSWTSALPLRVVVHATIRTAA
jgi:hypothetical protein